MCSGSIWKNWTRPCQPWVNFCPKKSVPVGRRRLYRQTGGWWAGYECTKTLRRKSSDDGSGRNARTRGAPQGSGHHCARHRGARRVCGRWERRDSVIRSTDGATLGAWWGGRPSYWRCHSGPQTHSCLPSVAESLCRPSSEHPRPRAC